MRPKPETPIALGGAADNVQREFSVQLKVAFAKMVISIFGSVFASMPSLDFTSMMSSFVTCTEMRSMLPMQHFVWNVM